MPKNAVSQLVVGLGIAMMCGHLPAAAEESATTDAKGSTTQASASELPSAPVAPVAPTAPVVQKPPRTREEMVRAQLDGTQWTLQLTPRNEKAKPKHDTISFDVNKVASERLSKSGYGNSNYSLTIGGNKVAAWETMQSDEKDGVVFWRGEFDGSMVRGMVTERPAKGRSEDYTFSGTEMNGKAIAVSDVPPPAAQPPAVRGPTPPPQPPVAAVSPAPSVSVPAPAPASPTSTEEPRKKGWVGW